jgi:hypothetical protein
MPISLQESAAFTILGDYVVHLPRDFEAYCVKKNIGCCGGKLLRQSILPKTMTVLLY